MMSSSKFDQLLLVIRKHNHDELLDSLQVCIKCLEYFISIHVQNSKPTYSQSDTFAQGLARCCATGTTLAPWHVTLTPKKKQMLRLQQRSDFAHWLATDWWAVPYLGKFLRVNGARRLQWFSTAVVVKSMWSSQDMFWVAMHDSAWLVVVALEVD